MYYKGCGVKQNYKKAIKWFKEAAKHGHPNAQYNLGVMYFKGESVEKNSTEAIKWFKEAAKQGHPNAIQILNKK